MKLTTKSMGIIGLFVAATFVLNYTLYYAFFLLYLIILFTLSKQDAILYTLVYAGLFFLLSFHINTFINFVLLTLTTVIVLWFKDALFSNRPVHDYTLNSKIRFAIAAGTLFFVSNLFYTFLYAFTVLTPETQIPYVLANLPINILTSYGNVLLFSLVGYTVVSRLQLNT